MQNGDDRARSGGSHSETAADALRLRAARRHDGTTARHPEPLRVATPLSAEIEQIVTRIMDCAFAVHRALGPGFKESIYRQALCLEMDARGLKFEREKPIEVTYKHWMIPGQRVDLLIEGVVLVEIKSVPRLRKIHSSQVVSYLKTMNLRIGLLVNFKARVLKEGFKRVIY
jgi:GxxExxY protein